MDKTIEVVGSDSKVRVSTEPYGVFLEVGNLELPYSDNEGYASLTLGEAQELIKALQQAVDASV